MAPQQEDLMDASNKFNMQSADIMHAATACCSACDWSI